MRKCVLHIGMSKTGTSSLQKFLKLNSSRFSELGVGAVYQPRLIPSCVLDADDGISIFKSLGLTSVPDVKFYQEEKKIQLEKKFLSHDKVVISSEWLCGFGKKEILKLKDYLSNYFDDFQVIVYFRRQDRYAVSLYGLRLTVGETPSSPLSLTPAYKKRMDYLSVLKAWSDAFGYDAVKPRIFSSSEFVDGDLYSDFLHACQIESSPSYEIPEKSNESMSKAAQEFLLRLNSHEPRFLNGQPNKRKDLVIKLLKENFKGKGKKPSMAQAKEFMSQYEEVNAHICSQYFPSRKHLFDEDYSDYPEADELLAVDESELEEVYSFVAYRFPDLDKNNTSPGM